MVFGVAKNVQTAPRVVQRTRRRDVKRVITSGDAGYFLPLAHIPLLREDSLRMGRMGFNFNMGETADLLLNGVNVKVEAHFVPKLAFERFRGMESFNRSWAKQEEVVGEPESVIPFFEGMTIDHADYPAVFTALGVHAHDGATVNDDLIRSYNVLVNWQRAMRSKSLPLRLETDTSLARCFWQNTQLSEVVPSFDSQQIHGDVPIEFIGGKLPVRGIGMRNDFLPFPDSNVVARESDGTVATYTNGWEHSGTANKAIQIKGHQAGTDSTWYPDIYAELEAGGVSMSLANLELARKTQAFAQMRNRYQGLSDDYLIDMLMDGIRIPDIALKEPMLLAQRSALFGWSQRYATDFANLEKSMTEGVTRVDLDFRMPATSTGGVILFTASITPEQLFERQKDHSVYMMDQEDYPQATVDELTPEKVELMLNKDVDVAHTVDGVFGYRPMNASWMRDSPNVGGRFMRKDPNAAWDEDRNRFWAAEGVVDPELTEDFYLCTNLTKDIFADANVDSLEINVAGATEISGHTVFGGALREATDSYETLIASVPQDRIDQDAQAAATLPVTADVVEDVEEEEIPADDGNEEQ